MKTSTHALFGVGNGEHRTSNVVSLNLELFDL